MNATTIVDPILDIPFRVHVDNSIAHCETYAYETFGPMSYSNCDEIIIKIQNQDVYLYPHKSSLHIIGRLLKKDGQVCTNTKIINNGICHLFQEIKYRLNGEEIDCCKNPGITCTMKGYVSYNSNQSCMLENAGWTFSNENAQVTDKNGYFDVSVPLACLLGFAEDYTKVIIKAQHELVLVRAKDDLNAIIQTIEEDVVFQIRKIEWRMPQIQVSDLQKAEMMERFEEKDHAIPIAFRTWELYEYPMLQASKKQIWTVKTTTELEKPRYILIGFQTDKKNDALKDCSLFDHCTLNEVKLYLNSRNYPHGNLNLDINKNQYALLYDMYSNFQNSYYGCQSEPIVKKMEFLSTAPLIVIDCSKQTENSKCVAIDVRVEFESNNAFKANTTAFCLIIHDRIVEYHPINGIVRKLF